MRQWMCHPTILCRKHLVAEYNECAMFVGTLRKGISVKGYIDNDLFEPLSLLQRHETLRREMQRRGYKHDRIIEDFQIKLGHLPKEYIEHKINRKRSLKELLMRCDECLKRFRQFKDYINPLDAFGNRYTCLNCGNNIIFEDSDIEFEYVCSNCKSKLTIIPNREYYVYKKS